MPIRASARNEEVTKYWLAFYTSPDRCLLCGNRGRIETYTGGTTWCICPNGQALRENDPAHHEPEPTADVMTPTSKDWGRFVKALTKLVETQGCDHTLENATTILTYYPSYNAHTSLRYFRERGGHCDCEILLNVTATKES